MRPKTLDVGYDFGQQQSQRVTSGVAPTAVVTALTRAAPGVASADDSDESENDEEDVREIDLSADSPVYSDVASSSSSSAPSPVNGARNDDARESTSAATATATPLTEPVKIRAHSISDDLPDWLQDRPLLSPSYSQASVQQIEDDIRHALDAAASRVTRESERRDRFQHELSRAASQAVSVDYSGQSTSTSRGLDELAEQQQQVAMPPAHPELLLLMEVVIGEGRSETIEVHVGDAPQTLAAQFATKHALKPESVPKLTQLIQDQLDALNLDELGFFDDTAAAVAPNEAHQQTEWTVSPPPAPMSVPRQQQQSMLPQQQQTEPRPSFQAPEEPTETLFDADAAHSARRDVDSDCEKQEREYSRAMNYQSLMAKYGHYSQHSGKVNPSSHERGSTSTGRLAGAQNTSSSGAARGKDALTFRNIQLAEHTRDVRRHTLSGGSHHHHAHASASTSKHRGGKAPAVFDRLYALAETKDKWIRRAQNAKQRELEKEQTQRKVEMAAKSRDLIAHRSTGGYAHIGERLYDEALSDLAKKDRLRAQRAAEREEQIDWMCPKCAFVNQHSDDVCKNVVAQPTPLSSSSSHDEPRTTRRESIGAFNDMGSSETICGQRKPEQLFRPTLLASSASVASAVHHNKERAARIASIRRERSQQAIEDEFRQACPFKPTINEVSEEIVRERLESEARVLSNAAVATTTTASGELRRKDPHLALYEDSFTVRANRQAREDEYLRQYSFKPDIGVNALWVSGEDVVERLAVSKYQELEKKRQALHDKYAPDRDPTSGRAFFKPETGRAPAFSRNERGLPIGAFLYESHREQQAYHRRLLQQSMDELQQQRQQGFVSEASRQALAARKAKTFRRIFDALVRVSSPRDASGDTNDSGESGAAETSARDALEPDVPPRAEPTQAPLVVTPSHVQLALLPREIAQVVPIVFELANREAFTYEQFAAHMEKLMTDVPGFTYTQVLFLAEHLRDGKSSRASTAAAAAGAGASNNSDDADELTFHPTIDKNSAAIAKKHGRADRSKVFHALHQYCEHYKDRKAQIQKQQQREFERLHPFKPQCVAKQSKHLAAGFYDKLKQQELADRQQQQMKDAPPLLHTALANARPCVRPIDSDATEPPRLETRSSSGSSSQFFDDLGPHASSDEDADLTSRVLAALDESPSQLSSALAPSSSAASSSSEALRQAKLVLTSEDAGQLRAPESAKLATS